MPANTAMPMASRISAPAPKENTSGNTPAMKAIDVIRIGRSLSRAASLAASTTPMPRISSSRANSTIRMAFLHASPTRTMKPIWVKMLLSPPLPIWPKAHTPKMAESRPMGTIITTAIGSVQLS